MIVITCVAEGHISGLASQRRMFHGAVVWVQQLNPTVQCAERQDPTGSMRKPRAMALGRAAHQQGCMQELVLQLPVQQRLQHLVLLMECPIGVPALHLQRI